MSSPVDEDSSLDSLLSKYGTSKQSVKHAEMGEESSAEDYHQDEYNREPPSQFLKEIRERAQILSKNAVKSRKTALQNVVSDNLALSATGRSLDLFVDVIRSADILEDKASPSSISQTKYEASELYSDDVLLQPVVPLDSVPWSMEDEDSTTTSSDYYKGLRVEPWGVPTTDTLEENDSEDSTSEESVESENEARPPNHVLDQDDLLGNVNITPYTPSISTNHEENILDSGSYFDVRMQTKIAEEPQLVGNLDREGVTDDENIEDDTSSAITRRVIDRTDDVCFKRLTSLDSKTEEISVKENKEESETYVRILDDETASGVPPQEAQFVSSVDSSTSNINFESNSDNVQLEKNTDNRPNTSLVLHPRLSDKAVILSSNDGPTEDHQNQNLSCEDTGSFDIQVSPTPYNQHLQNEFNAKKHPSGNNKPTDVASCHSEKTMPQTFDARVEVPVESSDHSFELLKRLESDLDDRGDHVDNLLENKEVNEIAQSSEKTTDEQGPIDNDKRKIRKDADSQDIISDKLKPVKLFSVSKFNCDPQPSYKSNAKEFRLQKNVEDQGVVTHITGDCAESSEELDPSQRQNSPSSPSVENPKPNLGGTDIKSIVYFSPNRKDGPPDTSGKSLVISSSQEQQRISRNESRKEIKIHARKITENGTSINTNNHDVRLRQLSIPKNRLNVSQGKHSPETQLSNEEPKGPRNVRSLIALFSNSEKANLSPIDSPRSPKVFNWNVSQPTRRHKMEETVFSFSSSRRDLEKRPPLSPDPVSSNDGSNDTQDVPWMRELKERRRRRQQGVMQAE